MSNCRVATSGADLFLGPVVVAGVISIMVMCEYCAKVFIAL